MYCLTLFKSPIFTSLMNIEEQTDFRAVISYLSANQGGLKIPISSGYRAHIKFEFIEKQSTAEQIFEEEETIFPDDNIEAQIKLISPEYYTRRLSEGTSFELSHGERLIGTGIIKQVLNSGLKRNNK